LSGLFDTDGSVQGNHQKGVSVRLSSIRKQHLALAQKMLLNLGVVSTLYEDRQRAEFKDLPGGSYWCHSSHELVISNDNLGEFAEQVGFVGDGKRSALQGILDGYARKPNRERFVATVADFIYLGVEDVYDCTIEERHAFDANGIIAHNCSEQQLHHLENCNLVETFPYKCDDYDDFERTLKFAYLYAKVVTLVPTHNRKTNAVMQKNRRIGCSQSGIWDNINRVGLREHLNWCDKGYKAICAIDEEYSNWLGIPKSIRKTSVKPSGSISKLPKAREGIHQAKGEYEIQSMRINDNSPLIVRS